MVRPKQISDSDLLKAAREAFLRDGPKTAVTEIAERLGVSAAALFQRVGSKAQLMLLSLLPGLPSALTAFAQKPARERPVSVQLEEHLAELMAFLKAVVPSMIVLRAAKLFPPPHKPARRGAAAPEVPAPLALRDALGAWLLAAQKDGRIEVKDPRVCAEALLGAMEARCFNAHVGGDDYVRGQDAEFLKTLVAGLLTDNELPQAGIAGPQAKRARREKKEE
jgi:AcrR family transcriptional regulator